ALPLGRPVVGVLQLLFPAGTAPGEYELAALGTFGVRAAHALRASARGEELSSELERTRTLLAVVGQATAELSLAHTLETAVDRLAELFAVEQVAVYLRMGVGRTTTEVRLELSGSRDLVHTRLPGRAVCTGQ